MRDAKNRVWDFLVGQDCWYLLSGFLMLLGCFLMSQAPGADSVELAAGLRLQTVVLAYQIAVVGLAIFVRRKLRVDNDAFNLACVALVLLPDPTFFSTRFWGHSHGAGLAVNGVSLIASVLMLVFLAEVGKFPIEGRSMGAWITTLAAVYGAGSVLEPGSSGANAVAMDLLALLPLVLAALAGEWNEGPAEETRQARLDPRLAKHPVLWGDPGRIYRRYLAAIVIVYPALVMLRHLYGLSGAFGLELDGTRVAPFILAIGILLAKVSDRALQAPGLMGIIGIASILVSGSRLSAEVPMFPLMVAANLLFGLWVHWRRGGDGLPVHALIGAVVLVSGRTPQAALEGIFTLSPGPLALFVALAVLHAARDQGFWEIWAACLSALLLVLRVAPVGSGTAVGALLHGGAILYLVLVHLYPRKDLYPVAGLVATLMLVSLMPGAHEGGRESEVFAALLAAETVGFFLAGFGTPVRGYLLAAGAVTLFETGVVVLRGASRVDLASLFWNWGGPAAILLAFATLAMGLAGSRQRAAGGDR
ncbi:MAG: hypothetical protein HY303_09130 [Candidatus Wallbacteria bacterium]|nr:hypothetical protein [Candidatus Wallbacteria bacterium]